MGLFIVFARVTESPGGTSKYPRKCSASSVKRPNKCQDSPNTELRTGEHSARVQLRTRRDLLKSQYPALVYLLYQVTREYF
jgi:hypothetical protein